MNRHFLPLLPALDGGHVALEVGRDFLPRIQPVQGRFHGWPSRAPDWSAVVASPGTRLYRRYGQRQSTVFEGTEAIPHIAV